jgi:CRP/FNR family transcriptional regulator, nitrogen oxide reductase regulator
MASNPNFQAKLPPDLERNLPTPARTVRVGPNGASQRVAQNSWATRVQGFTLFANIPVQDCSTIVGAARERSFSRGQLIYIEGDAIHQVALLTSGSAKMVQCNQNGSEVILRLCGLGELVGTLGNSIQARYRCTSRAVTSISALVWESSVFESLSTQFPSLRLNVAYILYKQLEDMEDRFREISTERVASRLSRQVLRLVEQVGIRLNGTIEISITREELAQLIGTSLFTVSRLLAEWDRKRIVTTRRKGFSVNNLKALAELID